MSINCNFRFTPVSLLFVVSFTVVALVVTPSRQWWWGGGGGDGGGVTEQYFSPHYRPDGLASGTVVEVTNHDGEPIICAPRLYMKVVDGSVQGPMGPEEDPYLVGALRFQKNSQSVLDSDDTIHRCFIKTILRVAVSGQQEGQTIHV